MEGGEEFEDDIFCGLKLELAEITPDAADAPGEPGGVEDVDGLPLGLSPAPTPAAALDSDTLRTLVPVGRFNNTGPCHLARYWSDGPAYLFLFMSRCGLHMAKSYRIWSRTITRPRN